MLAAVTWGHDLARLFASPDSSRLTLSGSEAVDSAYSAFKFRGFSFDVLCTILVTFLDLGRAGQRISQVPKRVVSLLD